MGENMKIIAQKNNNLNTSDFLSNSLSKDYIDGMSFNVTYTKDNKIIVFNTDSAKVAVTNTINNSTLEQLQEYEIILLDDLLKSLSKKTIKKDIYINLSPTNQGILSDENISEIAKKTNDYIDALKTVIDSYRNLNIKLHSVNRGLITNVKKKIPGFEVGFIFTGEDLNYIDVDYYVLISSTQNDAIIDILLKKQKKVILYISSDYYLSYFYEHYLGEKSTPYLQKVFAQLGILTNYPEVIYKVFSS